MTLVDKWKMDGTLNDRREMLVRLASKKFGLTDKERRLIEDCDDLERLALAIDELVFAETKKQVLAKLRLR